MSINKTFVNNKLLYKKAVIRKTRFFILTVLKKM